MAEQPCAFHPDRLTVVRCSRCERPICPDDMIDAPVGIHCPICAGRMTEGALSQRSYRARTRLERTKVGRRMTGLSLTQAIVATNVGIFVLMVLDAGSFDTSAALYRFGATVNPLPASQWWRVLTAMFVHVNFLHIAFNMYALFLFGQAIEVRHGKPRFLALYLLSGVLGTAASLAFGPSPSIGAGASGGVFGIIGAWIAFFLPHRRVAAARAQLQSLFFLVGINVFIGLSIRGIDNMAHLGGLVGGFVIGSALEYAGKRPRGPASLVGVGGYLVVLIAALVLIVPNLA